ncbi:MAG: HD domain-containing protein [Phycisphaerales bacterium]
MNARTRLWQEAASFSAWKHRHQMRKDGRTPYAAHPFRVAMAVRDVFGCDDAEAIAAALLHDTIEDTLTDYDDLESRFGATVADIVASLTKNMALREDAREAEYDTRLAVADWRARLVKLADAFDNLSDLSSLSQAERDKLADPADKARRAIALADPDAKAHPEVGRAIEAVRAMINARSVAC